MSSPLSTKRQAIGFAGWLLVAYATGAIGAIASIDARDFYQSLVRPEWAPPGAVFGPVWNGLYFLMGVSVWLVWRERGSFAGARTALTLFLVQLAANALWSWLFFGWRLGAAASIEVLVLWGLILATIIAFWRVRPAAGVLMLPYLAWVSFAAVLCFTLWRSNPQAL